MGCLSIDNERFLCFRVRRDELHTRLCVALGVLSWQHWVACSRIFEAKALTLLAIGPLPLMGKLLCHRLR